jgi:hypothetical protein
VRAERLAPREDIFCPTSSGTLFAASGEQRQSLKRRAKAMEADIIITIALVGGAVLIFHQLGRIIRASMLHRTVREALSRDGNLAPELLDRIEEQKTSGLGDGRAGLVLVALAAALFAFGLIQGDPEDVRNLASIAVFPLFVGAALLGRIWFLRRRGEIS